MSRVPGEDQYYLTWCYNGPDVIHRIFNLVFDSDGNIIVDWHIAYNYDYEELEDLKYIDGVTDDSGNLYLIFSQGETEPVLGTYPTFGWFDYNYVSTLQQEAQVESSPAFSLSSNPVTGSVTVHTSSGSNALRVFDISGREVSEISVSEGVGIWNGAGYHGERLPSGIYNIVDTTRDIQRVTLLNQ